MSIPLLSVRGYRQVFTISKNYAVCAVNGVSFDVHEGEIFGLIGESGCGKSTLARAIMGLYAPTEGEIRIGGTVVSDKRSYRANRQQIQRTVQGIFQDSAAALNPRMTVAESLAEPLMVSGLFSERVQRRAEVDRLLDLVGLDTVYRDKFPAEISGGQRQRVAIARSLAGEPRLLVADEPVAALDVSIQSQIINLFMDLQRCHNLSLLYIAHDLAMVRYLCHRVAVMYAGTLVEIAQVDELFENPLHPYTQALLSAMPIPDPQYERRKKILLYVPSAKDMDAPWREVTPSHCVRG